MYFYLQEYDSQSLLSIHVICISNAYIFSSHQSNEGINNFSRGRLNIEGEISYHFTAPAVQNP